jgi:hypothetical protein
MVEPTVLDLDPFDEAFLSDPEAHHDALRDAGPVVFLESYGIWAMARYSEVHAAIRDHGRSVPRRAWA